jgi:hypothetical protein
MLKYVVPVYLLVIFVGFAWAKLPSGEEKLFALDSQVAAALDEGALASPLVEQIIEHERQAAEPPATEAERNELAEELAARRAALEKLVVSQSADGWKVRNAERHLLFVVKPEENGGPALYRHVPGYFEKVLDSPVALSAVSFIGAFFVFLLVMIHLAGQRWEAEGRLTYGEIEN